jgi:WD40 repeat protein
VFDDQLLTGTMNGCVYVWQDCTVGRSVKAHEGPINAIHSTGDLLCTGARDGAVKVWGRGLENLYVFNIAEAGPPPYHTSIMSVRILPDDDRSTLLVATQSSDVYEITKETGRMQQLASGHCMDEVWGLAAHPTNPSIFVTAGDDMTLRLWNADVRRQLGMVVMGTHIRAVAWSPDGSVLAVGLGGRVGRGRHRKDGTYYLLKASDLSVLHEGQDSRDWITDIRFSPNGKFLALASQDSKVYMYSLSNTGVLTAKLVARCEMSNSAVTHVDFDSSSTFIQTNDNQLELLFYRAANGEQITHPSELRDADWATWTATLGWPVQAIWPRHGSEGSVTATARSHDRKLLASVEDTGKLRMWRYPAVERGVPCHTEIAHAAACRRVDFVCGDARMLTAGGADRTVMQWRVVDPAQLVAAAEADE